MKKNRGRTSGTRNQKKNILIVCEGTTEEIYIKGLKSKYRLATVSITVKESSGGSAIKVFELAKREEKYNKRDKAKKYDEVYCIFDNDNKEIDREISPALIEMRNNNYIPIYSNISFELWLLMHYESYMAKTYNNAVSCEKALKKLDINYHKTKYNIENYINKIELAKEKSLKLMKNFDVPKSKSELSMNPYTNMALLIKKFEDESNS